MKRYLISLLLLLPGLLSAASRPPVVHHRMTVSLDPGEARLQVEDEITLSRPRETLEFLLHQGLIPRLLSPEGKLSPAGEVDGAVPAQRWKLKLATPARKLRLAWSGHIRHPPRPGRLHATPGTISLEGAQLSAGTLWYPWWPEQRVTFRMDLDLPDGWHGISQGRPDNDDRHWESEHPQQEILLVAAPFERYRRQSDGLLAMAWLLNPDPALARRYIDATFDYIDLYSRLIGPYPYAKFALVENFWPSGYGLPSFTLLGSQVIRLPFILRSSFPHEILHNWWGNSVFVDWRSGNWSEGLTAYLADHLLQEQQGKGAQYRHDILLKYANWVRDGNDIPLVRFRSRHGEASQAAGYGRMLMFMHMLRLRLGNRVFIEGLRRFYRDNRFAIAGFDDLRRAFEAVSGTRLAALFDQWTKRTGAPVLRLEGVTVERKDKGYRVTGRLRQTQQAPPFRLRVPLYLQLQDGQAVQIHWLEMTGREKSFQLHAASRPLRLRVDPRYDLFRRLDPEEIPPSLGALFSAHPLYLVLPDSSSEDLHRGYRLLAERWKQRYPQARIVEARKLDDLPDTGAVWILGRHNRFAGRVWDLLARQCARLQDDTLVLNGERHPLAGGSLVLTAKDRIPLGLLLLGDAGQAASLAGRLPHYGKYGYLLFDADGSNRLKGQWQTGGGALEARLAKGPLPPLRLKPRPPLFR